MKHYRSSIPKSARERVTATQLRSPLKYKAEFYLNRQLVGIRFFAENGELSSERPLRNGVLHGKVFRCEPPGRVISAEPYFNGKQHGIATQWSHEGEFLGSYVMRHGTGVDLWWQKWGVSPHLSEARFIQNGRWNGFEWWLNQDQKTVHRERHYRDDRLHGIERVWNARGRLRRGYPKYWVDNKGVSKRHYLRACAVDLTLPKFLERDNRPLRRFPPEVAVNLHKREPKPAR